MCLEYKEIPIDPYSPKRMKIFSSYSIAIIIFVEMVCDSHDTWSEMNFLNPQAAQNLKLASKDILNDRLL